MSEQQVKDPETMSFEELQALANEEMTPGGEGEETKEPTTKGAGEGTKAAPDAGASITEPAETVYRYEINLGDGSGKQVFEAESPEALIEKLGEAQRNATIKIRELAAAKKVEPKVEEKTLTADEEWLLAQELVTSPSKAFDKILQARTGMTADELKALKSRVEAVDAREQQRSREQTEYNASLQFREAHPDYVANEGNGKKMVQWLRLENLPGTVENITKAYEDLKQSGLLELQDPQAQGAKVTTGTRIVTVGQHTRKVASGLSTRRSASVTRAAEPTEEDAYKMSYAELEKLANQQAGQA